MPIYRKSVLQTLRHRITELFRLEGTLKVISHLFYSLVEVICYISLRISSTGTPAICPMDNKVRLLIGKADSRVTVIVTKA